MASMTRAWVKLSSLSYSNEGLLEVASLLSDDLAIAIEQGKTDEALEQLDIEFARFRNSTLRD